MNRAVFLDKDGTLVENVPYNIDPKQIRLAPGAVDGLRIMQAAGFQLFVVSNQSGVARGYFAEAALDAVWEEIAVQLAASGVRLSGFYYCPHHPQGVVPEYAIACACRKPAPGMLLQAARQHNLDLGQSWLVGDILHDVQAGRAAGCRTVLIDNGNETEWLLSQERLPHAVVRDLADAGRVIAALSPRPPAAQPNFHTQQDKIYG